MIFHEYVPLAPHTTLGVGGPARYLLEIDSDEEISAALEFAQSRKLPLFVMGGGSNLVVADAGYPGVVVKIGLRGVEREEGPDGKVNFDVAAGEDWDTFVQRTIAHNCSGLECLSGIPGKVGATPIQNVGAYGQEVAECIQWVRAVELSTGRVDVISAAQCQFGYRSSRFNTIDRQKYVIAQVRFQLQVGGTPALRYPELQNYFSGDGREPTLGDVRETVLKIRRNKSMVLDPDDENFHSAGSFFKNPVVTQRRFEDLAQRTKSRGVAMPSYPAGEGMRKLSAAWLVEQAGFVKGYARGAVGISTRHSLALVNRGGAQAAEVVALAEEIRSGVSAEFGVELAPEPVFVGF